MRPARPTTPPADRGRLLWVAVAGLVLAGAAGRVVTQVEPYTGLSNGTVASLLSYVVIWVPLVAALVVAMRILGSRETVGRWHLRFHPLDLFWGFAAGCLARASDGFVNQAFTGTTGLAPQLLLGEPRHGIAVVIAIVAPVVLAPLIEELFFRGLFQSSLTGVLGGKSTMEKRAGIVIAVVLTSALFALLHVVVSNATGSGATVTLIGTFVFGLLAGALTAATGRLGPAFVAHVVFNGIAVYLTWPR